MGAVIRWCPCGCRKSASLRLGPQCNEWLGDYTHMLTVEIEDGDIGVIGGLNWEIKRFERRWIEAAFIHEGLRMAMDRIVRDSAGMPALDETGKRQVRRVMLAMPRLSKRTQPALP